MVGWARFCAHADAKPRGQTINLSAHPTLFSENKFTLLPVLTLLDNNLTIQVQLYLYLTNLYWFINHANIKFRSKRSFSVN